jgi:glutamine amidotransferase-like uncharacterized protein
MPTLRRAAAATAFVILISTFALGQEPKPAKPAVPVAMYNGAGVGGNGPKMLEEKFHADTEFRITRLKPEEIRQGKLKDYKVLIVPGGSSKTEGIALGEDGREEIKKFVEGGGVYVGICAGCYLASCNYEWSLHILPAKVVDTANWERGRGNLKLELTKEGKEWTARAENEVTTIYHNGPVLQEKKDEKEKLIPLALYREELTKKGAKEGLMVNTPAIAAARFGKGWAIGVSPHPEQTENLRDMVPSVIRWAMANPAK